MRTMTNDQAVEALKAIPDDGDSEYAHMNADKILLKVLQNYGHAEVVEAYQDCKRRLDFWYA